MDLLAGNTASLKGGHSFFESDLLPEGRAVQLSDPQASQDTTKEHKHGQLQLQQSWTSYRNLPKVLDLFQDGSMYIVDAPGHLAGHINLLARVGPSENDLVYLAGDTCHDRRIIRKQKDIGHWHDAKGQVCCIHADEKAAKATIDRVRTLEEEGVEVIFAHDVEWEQDPKNKGRFFGH